MTEPVKISDPNPQDVLSGRGSGARKHPGNVRYNQLLHEYHRDYVNSPKGTKRDIVFRILAAVNEGGGRFLDKQSESDSYWIEMNKEKVYAKVSQGIRDLRVTGPGVPAKKPNVTKAKEAERASRDGVGRPGRFDPAKSALFTQRFPNNGTLPGQPRRLSFSERVKLLQQQQMKAMKGGSDDDDDDGSDDGEEADEEESEGEASEEDDEQEELEKDVAALKTDSVQEESATKQAASGTPDAPDDVSETETEDSFPTQRGDEEISLSNEVDSDEDM
jgi:hypothetical protein